MNGDDDIPESIMGGTDWGGGMYDTPDPIPDPDIEDEARFNKRRTQRRHPRPKFRSERKARRTPR